jgi:hypothetical protein
LVILTAVLAGVTAIYAYTTWLLVKESRATRETQQMQYQLDNEPKVRIGTKWYGVNLFTYVVNVGRTPVLNLNVQASITLQDSSKHSPINPGMIVSKLLMPGEREQFMVPDCRFGIIQNDFHSIKLSGECKDVHGDVHAINEEWIFDIPEAAKNPEEGIWQTLPHDEPLIQVKKSISEIGRDISASIKSVKEEIEKIGPTSAGYCSKCHKIYRIDVRGLDIKCENCGEKIEID